MTPPLTGTRKRSLDGSPHFLARDEGNGWMHTVLTTIKPERDMLTFATNVRRDHAWRLDRYSVLESRRLDSIIN